MRTPWEIQYKGLWGLSLGFPSEAYSLHFISWLTRCVPIHLELLRSFDTPFLQVLLIRDRRTSLQLKSPCPAGGWCRGPGWRWAALFPHTKGRGPAVSSTPQNPLLTLLGQLRVHPPLLCQNRQVSWQCAFCVPPHGAVGSPPSISQWDTQLLHGYSQTCMLALRKLPTCKGPHYPCTHRYQ